jgi:hypothetical protein
LQQQSVTQQAAPSPQLFSPHPPLPRAATPVVQADLAGMLSAALDQADAGLEMSNEPWSGPGDIRIQPGLTPGLAVHQGGDQANAIPGADFPALPAQPGPEPFWPMPPQDAKRPSPKRMPELTEFPLVAQREYREHQARHQGAGEPSLVQPAGSPMTSGPRVYTPPAPVAATAPRKPGLFERLTGKGRKDAESVDFGANHTTASTPLQESQVSALTKPAHQTLQADSNDPARQQGSSAHIADNKRFSG